MILVEMLLGGENATGSVMIHVAKISEVEELGSDVRITMDSGNSYVINGESFAATLNTIEGINYLKLKTAEQIEAERQAAAEAEAEEPAKEVEGELVGAEEPCC